MAGRPTPEENLLAITAQAREVLTDLRAATKDARAAHREMRDYLRTNVLKRVDNEIDAQVRRILDELGEATSRQIQRSSARVIKTFDHLAAILLGTEKHDGDPSLRALIKQMAKRADGEYPEL